MHDVVDQSHSHFIADLFAGGDQSHSEDGSLAMFFFAHALMNHILDLQNVATAHICEGNHHDVNILLNRMFNHINSLKGGLAFVLLSHIKKSQSNTKVSCAVSI